MCDCCNTIVSDLENSRQIAVYRFTKTGLTGKKEAGFIDLCPKCFDEKFSFKKESEEN